VRRNVVTGNSGTTTGAGSEVHASGLASSAACWRKVNAPFASLLVAIDTGS
jgi:hypothetical protein